MKHRIHIDRFYLFDPSAWVILRGKISGSPSTTLIKMAIEKAVSKYEILNSSITQDELGECYFEPNKRIETPDISIVHKNLTDEAIVRQQQQRTFDFQQDKLIRFLINSGSEGTYITIIQHHIVGDGESATILLNNIMSFMQEGMDTICNEGVSNEMIPIKLFTSEYLKQFIQLNPHYNEIPDYLNEEWKKENISFRFNDYKELSKQYAKTVNTGFKSAKIKDHTYTTFCNICKENGVTVNTAIVTMIIQYFRVIEKLSMSVNLRTSDFEGMGDYVSALTSNFVYNQNDSFWENANRISDYISSQLKNRMELGALLFQKGLYDSGLKDALHFNEMKDCVRKCNDISWLGDSGTPIFISNLGNNKFSEKFQKYNLEEVSFISPLISGVNGNLAIISTNNCMVLNMQYHKDQNVIDYSRLFDDIVNQINNI